MVRLPAAAEADADGGVTVPPRRRGMVGLTGGVTGGAIAAGLVAVSVASAAAPRTLIDRTLERRPVDLLGWSEAGVLYRDDLGRQQRAAAGEYIAFLPASPAASLSWGGPPETGQAGGTPIVVELVDGQRLFGSMGPWASSSVGPIDLGDGAAEGEAPAADSLAVYAEAFGVSAVALDRVSRVVIDPWSRGAMPDAWTPGVDDELVLANGDVLRGFVVSLGDGIVFDDGQAERRFDLASAAEVRLGNPLEPQDGPRVWWSNGEIRDAVATGDAAAGSVALDVGAAPVEVGDLEAGWFLRGRPVALAGLETLGYEPLGGRRWTAPPRVGSEGGAPLGTPHVELPGPMAVRWRLPADAVALGTVVRLGGRLGDPTREPGPWADATVLIELIGGAGEPEPTVVAEVPLTRDAPERSVAVDLPGAGASGRVLRVSLLPGAHGSVHDVVLLDAPMLTTN